MALQCEDGGIFMKPNCVQMLIFKQRSIRWISPPPPPPTSFHLLPHPLMKSSAGAEGTTAALRAQLNERTAHDSAPLGSRPASLGRLSGVKHRPFKPPLQARVPEHGKTEVLRLQERRAHLRKDEILGHYEQRSK